MVTVFNGIIFRKDFFKDLFPFQKTKPLEVVPIKPEDVKYIVLKVNGRVLAVLE